MNLAMLSDWITPARPQERRIPTAEMYPFVPKHEPLNYLHQLHQHREGNGEKRPVFASGENADTSAL